MANKYDKSTDTDVYIGKQIRLARQLSGISQQELGDHIGMVHSQIHNYENGLVPIKASVLIEIANKLKVTMDWLYVGDTPTHYGQATMSTDILRDVKAMRHLQIYKDMNPTHQHLLRVLAKELIGVTH